MDIFGRKKIAALENVIKSQSATIHRQNTSELAVHRKIREMDQLIFAMYQCSSWEQMRPIFIKLQAMADARMLSESHRIQQVLIPEMQKTYRGVPLKELPKRVLEDDF